MAFSPDGATLATTGGEGKRIRLWDVETARHEATLAGHLWDVVSVAFSPDGATLASGSGDGTVRLWSVANGLHTATLEGHGDWVYSVAFSPDGSLLASGARDGEVRVWDVATGRHKVTLPHRSLVYYLAFSPDGATLAGGGGSEVRLWDVASGQPRGLAADGRLRDPFRDLLTRRQDRRQRGSWPYGAPVGPRQRTARVRLALGGGAHGERAVGSLLAGREEPGQYGR